MNARSSHTPKHQKALLEIPSVSYCRCPKQAARVGKRLSREGHGLASLSQEPGAAGRRGDTVGRVKLRRALEVGVCSHRGIRKTLSGWCWRSAQRRQAKYASVGKHLWILSSLPPASSPSSQRISSLGRTQGPQSSAPHAWYFKSFAAWLVCFSLSFLIGQARLVDCHLRECPRMTEWSPGSTGRWWTVVNVQAFPGPQAAS